MLGVLCRFGGDPSFLCLRNKEWTWKEDEKK